MYTLTISLNSNEDLLKFAQIVAGVSGATITGATSTIKPAADTKPVKEEKQPEAAEPKGESEDDIRARLRATVTESNKAGNIDANRALLEKYKAKNVTTLAAEDLLKFEVELNAIAGK